MQTSPRRSLVLALAPLVLMLTVVIAWTAPASAAPPRTSAHRASTIQPGPNTAAVARGYPSIWSLPCNIITLYRIGINPSTGQLYMCEYEDGIGYVWLPILICPNIVPDATDRSVDAAEPSAPACR
jgi:hypothetical protein